MCARGFLVSFLVCGLKIANGYTFSDIDRCIFKTSSDKSLVENEYCMVSKNDVHLFCPENMVIAISSLQFATKNTMDFCMKRILKPRDFFCCTPQDHDTAYAGDCLQDIWSPEDKQYYNEFIAKALEKCMNKSHCVLTSDMFKDLQREIPTTKTYSSYYQIIHRCIQVPTSPIKPCSSISEKGKEIHFQHNYGISENVNKTCKCRLTSQSDGHLTVKAVDVRTNRNGLIIKSDNSVRDMSRDNLPLFGLKEIFAGNNIDISVKNSSVKNGNTLWLHIKESNGEDVSIVCGAPKHESSSTAVEITTQAKTTATPAPVKEVPVKHGQREAALEFHGIWPIIYIAAGAVITLIPIACILGCIVLCRYSSPDEKEPHHKYCHQPHQTRADFHQDVRGIPYATVLDEVHSTPSPLPTHQHSPRVNNVKPRLSSHLRASPMQGHPLPIAPSPQTASTPGRRTDDATSSSLLSMTPGTSCDVSEIDSFLEFKSPIQGERSPGIGGLHDRSQHHRPASASRHDSGFSEGSHERPPSHFGFESRPDSNSFYFVLERAESEA